MGAMQSGESSAAECFHLPAGPAFARYFSLGTAVNVPGPSPMIPENGVLVLGTVPMHLLAVVGSL
jgi:hypothetical protein